MRRGRLAWWRRRRTSLGARPVSPDRTRLTRTLMPGRIAQIHLRRDGGWLVTTAPPDDHRGHPGPGPGRVTAVDAGGGMQWSSPLGRDRLAPSRCHDGAIWWGETGALHRIEADGTAGRTVEYPVRPGAALATFVVLDDGFLIGENIDRDAEGTADPKGRPTVTRVGPNGAWQWRSVISTRRVMPSRPPTWVLQGLQVEGDAVHATVYEVSSLYQRHAVLDADTGVQRWELELPHAAEVTPRGDGGLVVGTESGWDSLRVPNTRFVSPTGHLSSSHWPGSGPVVIEPDGTVRVIGGNRTEAAVSHVHAIAPDGRHRQGDALSGSITGGPVLAEDGSAWFWRSGVVQVCDADLRVRPVIEAPGIPHPTSAEGTLDWPTRLLITDDGRLLFGLGQSLCVVDVDDGVARMAQSPWPCQGGPAYA